MWLRNIKKNINIFVDIKVGYMVGFDDVRDVN